jgi:hypothetical protein
MAESRAKDQLQVEEPNQHPAVPKQGPRVLSGNHFGRFLQPASAGKDRDGRQHAKHGLPDRGMCGGDRGRQKVQDCEAAKHTLENYACHSAQRQSTHPAALVDAPRPYSNNNCQQTDELCDHAVRVLKFHTTDHFGQSKQMAEAGWPVRDRQPSIVAGDQPAGYQQ